MFGRIEHRVRQFLGALRPRVTPDERADAYGYLDPPLRALFETMTLRDQQHGIIVCRRVRAAHEAEDPTLFAAALLHDCGKGRVALWHRVLHVLAGTVSPSFEARLASEHGAGWRQALWRLVHHPALGAQMAEAAGAPADVVRMIRGQDAGAPDPRLALLQAADDA